MWPAAADALVARRRARSHVHRRVEALREGARGDRATRRSARCLSRGIDIARQKGDRQAEKEMTVFARRIERALAGG